MDNYIIANRTDVGRARQVNEDNMTTFDSPNGRVVAVCDGMGGQAAGDVASKLACDIICDILTNNNFPTAQEAITRAVLAANQGILHRAAQNPELSGMGSTCVIMIIKDSVVTYGWVGDSRIYILDNHTLCQLSRDQSYVQTLVDNGELSMAEAENHPQKNEIVNALGIEDMTPPVIGMKVVEPGRDTIFMLCSDGLSNMVNTQQIERELNKPGVSLQDKVDKLVFLANQYGGPDNITVQLVEFRSKPMAAAAPSAAAMSRKKAKKDNRMLTSVVAVLAVIVVCLCVFLFLYFKKPSTAEADQTATDSTPKTEQSQSSPRQSQPSQPVNESSSSTTTIINEKPRQQQQQQSQQQQSTKHNPLSTIKNQSNKPESKQEKSESKNLQKIINESDKGSTPQQSTPESFEFPELP